MPKTTASRAELWEEKADQAVLCHLCSHRCLLKPRSRGKCGVRHNEEGILKTITAGRIAAANLDPIEKKPLYHFFPGTTAFSIGTEGCNFSCGFCQNHELSQRIKTSLRPPGGHAVTPEILVEAARKAGAASIAYTYSEPTVFFELARATARLATENGLQNILVSNGYESRECLHAFAPHIQAANFDLKAYSDAFYEHCGARLKPVLETLRLAKKLGWWIEITTLLIPDANDAPRELTQLADFIASELGAETPWHISRYHPAYHFSTPPTPLKLLDRAADAGLKAGLKHVYIGNVPNHPLSHTYCSACGNLLISRSGYTTATFLTAGRCPSCKTPLSGRGFAS